MTPPSEEFGIRFSLRSINVKEYKLVFSVIDFNHSNPIQTVFPTVGYPILNLFWGEEISVQFDNYDFPEIRPSKLYITGLFAGEPAIFRHCGKGRDYALPIHPVIAYHLLQKPMQQLRASWDTVSNVRWKDESMISNPEEEARMISIENGCLKTFLQKVLPDKSVVQKDPIYRAVNSIIHRKGLINVKQLASDCCMTERTLNRQFLRKVGLSPKSYAKIWQLQYVMQLLQKPARSLSDLALKAGYYDAAHMAREFKNRLLQTPTEFLKNTSLLLQHYLASAGALK